MASPSGSEYRLDELGWLQFQRVATRVLEAKTGLVNLDWEGTADVGRVSVLTRDVVLAGRAGALIAPVTVAIVWVPVEMESESRIMRFFKGLAGPDAEPGGRRLVLTNLAGEEVRSALGNEVGAALGRTVVLGARELAASLDRHPEIRAALPSVLGLRDLRGLIDVPLVSRSTLDVDGAHALARVFWSTRAYDRALEVLTRHRFVVLTGPPEMGKTAIARMLALALMTDGWEAHECSDPDRVLAQFDPERRQVFVADDAFGSTEYRPDAGERWAAGLERLLGMLDDRHRLIWTSRPAPLKAGLARIQRERGAERFPAPGEVLVDASDLDLSEKTLILFRHVKDHGVSSRARSLIRATGEAIVKHPHFTPERIRRFVTGRLDELIAETQMPDWQARAFAGDARALIFTAVEDELANPTDAMRTSFDALEPEHRDLLVALLDAPAGLIDERALAETVRRHHSGGLSRPPRELIDRLTDHFLRVTPLGIGWVHPSWRDLVIEQLRADPAARASFLAACGIDGLMLALSDGGGAAGERRLPLLLGDPDWDALGDRVHQLLRELDERTVVQVLHALTAAVRSRVSGAQARELEVLATGSLRSMRTVWDRGHRPIPLPLLEAWLGLNRALWESRPARDVTESLDPPELERTWIELYPGSILAESRSGRAELARIDEWLVLADLLRRYAPSVLNRFDFYGRDRDRLARVIPALALQVALAPELRDLVESVLLRIEVLLPELGDGTHNAIEIGRFTERVESERWFVPDDLATPPSRDLVSSDTFTAADVRRVLEDL